MVIAKSIELKPQIEWFFKKYYFNILKSIAL